MSLFRTLDRTSAVSYPHANRPFLAFLYPVVSHKVPRRGFGKSAVNRPPRIRPTDGGHMGHFFIQALARAASCPEHARHMSTLPDVNPFSTTHHKTRRKISLDNIARRKYFKSTRPGKQAPFTTAKQFAENELKALVDYYGIEVNSPTPEEGEEAIDDGSLVWNVGDDHQPWPPKEPKDTETIEKLKKLLENEDSSHHDIFDTYKQLPDPRIVYLPIDVIRDMLHHLSIVERPSLDSMQRYLFILDDMKNAHIHIKRSEWTSAVRFAGRYAGAVSSDDLQSALYLWRDMEHKANVKASWVTFNILFDISVKAGKFTLAELFVKEMKARGLKFHRHFRVSLIYYHGVMQNGNGIRRVYQEMVQLGDIVDVVVLNSVIAALIRAGEPSAADQVFERMKRLASTGTTSPLPPEASPFKIDKYNRTWRNQRKLGIHLTYEGPRLKLNEETEGHKALQDWAPIAPNSHTYSLLIRHQASTTGNLDRINELLREMGYNGVPLEGSIFIVIFHGFSKYGGVRYSSWSGYKLEQTWNEYLQAVKMGLSQTWISQMSVIAALKAFSKCTDAERTLKAWEEVKTIWGPSVEETEAVLRTLRNLVPQGGVV